MVKIEKEWFDDFQAYFWLKEEILGIFRDDMSVWSTSGKGIVIDTYAKGVVNWW